MNKTYCLYGIAGASDNYRIVRYMIIGEEDFSIENAISEACKIRFHYPSIENV